MPHSTTGEPPSLLLMGRRLRNRLDLLTPSDYQSTPLDVSPDMDQPYEIVSHSIIPFTYIPPTATLVVQLVVQPNSLCEYPVDTEKRYPTRTTHRPPKHLKDYELK